MNAFTFWSLPVGSLDSDCSMLISSVSFAAKCCAFSSNRARDVEKAEAAIPGNCDDDVMGFARRRFDVKAGRAMAMREAARGAERARDRRASMVIDCGSAISGGRVIEVNFVDRTWMK